MKLNKNMTKIAAALALLGSMGAAHAGSVSPSTTRTADLTFTQPAGPVGIQITPEANLEAKVYSGQAKVATVTLTPTGSHVVAMRFTPGKGAVDANHFEVVLDGATGGTANKLKLRLLTTNFNYDTTSGYWAHTGPASTNPVTTQLNIDPQTVTADTYTVSMDAAAYTA